MTSKTRQTGNPRGRVRSKPFAVALRMEIAAAGENHKKLRAIARALLEKAERGDLQAINAVADRLDGKPAQETEHTVKHVPAAELTDDELATIIRDGSRERTPSPPLDPHQLN